MCEPLTASQSPALELAGRGAAGVTVVGQNVVLRQLAGRLLQVTQCCRDCRDCRDCRSGLHLTVKSEQE